eukprot:scaffold20167_cov56-Phaeocystis_antarctica.AAC.6
MVARPSSILSVPCATNCSRAAALLRASTSSALSAPNRVLSELAQRARRRRLQLLLLGTEQRHLVRMRVRVRVRIRVRVRVRVRARVRVG